MAVDQGLRSIISQWEVDGISPTLYIVQHVVHAAFRNNDIITNGGGGEEKQNKGE